MTLRIEQPGCQTLHRNASGNGSARALTFVTVIIMKTFSATTISGVVLTTLLFAFSASARDRSVLNGTWTLVPARSDFGGQAAVQTGTVTIDDNTGVVVISRNFIYEGATQTFYYSDSTGSENNSTVHLGKDFKTKTRWDRDVLRVTTTQSGAITTEDYSLNADGTMTVTVGRPDHKTFTLLFERQ
jgi:hypothetical protein